MQRFISTKPFSMIGLDIRMNEIRFVQLQHKKQHIIIEQADIVPLPSGAIVDGKIRLFEPVVESLRDVIQQFSLQHYPAVMALPIQCVITKKIHVPNKLTRKHCEQEIVSHISRYFPGVAQELCYDYVVLPAVEKLSRSALLVATRHEQLNDYVNAVERASLFIKIVDVDMYALVRAVQFVYPSDVMLPWIAIVDVDVATIQCVLLHQGSIIYHQQFYYQNSVDAGTKINNVLQHCFAMHNFKKIDKLFFTGNKEVIHQLVSQFRDKMSIIHVDFLQCMSVESSISQEKIQNLTEKLNICYGLALRRAPQW